LFFHFYNREKSYKKLYKPIWRVVMMGSEIPRVIELYEEPDVLALAEGSEAARHYTPGPRRKDRKGMGVGRGVTFWPETSGRTDAYKSTEEND
jgi:hypothetical protein